VLKRRGHAVDFLFRQTMPRSFVAPLRYGITDLLCNLAGPAVIQFEILRKRKGQCLWLDAPANLRHLQNIGYSRLVWPGSKKRTARVIRIPLQFEKISIFED
jgi:hypothetical protein